MPAIAIKNTYPVRTDVSLEVQSELLIEQGRRLQNQERISLMAIAAEWLEEITVQKREKRG